MCGRYAVSQSADDLADEFGVERDEVRERLDPDWNVAPTKKVYAVMTRGKKDEPDVPPTRRLRWGLVPSWAKEVAIGNRLINARVETAAEKPAFRKAFQLRRCILPADGFYEWRGEKGHNSAGASAEKRTSARQPFFIHPKDGSLAMAGLYEIWRDKSKPDDADDAFVWSVVILTTDATDDVGQIHDRMPMLVGPDSWERWLDPTIQDADDVTRLLTPAVPGVLDAYPVSTDVNKVGNNGPHLVDPVEL